MAELPELTIPRKRNVKELTVTLGALESGAPVSATFFTERFGAVNIVGAATLSPAVGAFVLAGQPLEQNLKPDKTLQTLVRSSGDETAVGSATEEVGGLGHGDLIRASLNDPAYGDFTITGVGVRSVVGATIMVGGWILSQNGDPAPRLRGVVRVAQAGGHVHPVPPQITAVADDAASGDL